VVYKMALGQVFSEYFGFPCQPHFIPPTSPSSQSPGTGTIGQYMAAVPRGHPIWTPPPIIRIKNKINKKNKQASINLCLRGFSVILEHGSNKILRNIRFYQIARRHIQVNRTFFLLSFLFYFLQPLYEKCPPISQFLLSREYILKVRK
jgi:hypothetical protein